MWTADCLMSQRMAKSIENYCLRLAYVLPDGYMTMIDKASGREFASAKLSGNAGRAEVKKISDDTFGPGEAIEVACPDRNKDLVIIFPQLPFALFRSSLHNQGL